MLLETCLYENCMAQNLKPACVQKHPMMTKITLEIASCIAIGLAQSTIGYYTTAR